MYGVDNYINNIIEDPPCYGLVKFLKEYNKYVTKLNKQYSDSDSSGSSEDEGGDEGEDEGGGGGSDDKGMRAMRGFGTPSLNDFLIDVYNYHTCLLSCINHAVQYYKPF